VVVGLDRRGGGLLVEYVLLDLDSRVDQVRLPRLQLPVRVERVLFELRVGHLQENRVGRDRTPGLREEAFDARVRRSGDLQDPFGLGNERARPPDLALEGAPLDRVDQDRPLVHGRRRRLQPGEAERDQEDRENSSAADQEAPPLLLLREVFPKDVHPSLRLARTVPRAIEPKSLMGKSSARRSRELLRASGNALSGNEQGNCRLSD